MCKRCSGHEAPGFDDTNSRLPESHSPVRPGWCRSDQGEDVVMRRTGVKRWLPALVVGVAVFMAACGDDDNTSSGSNTTAAGPTGSAGSGSQGSTSAGGSATTA